MPSSSLLPAVPPAAPRRRRVWLDPRFVLGLALVLASAGGVVALVSAVDASTRVLAARTVLTPGEHVSRGDFVTVEVRSGELARHYLAATAVPDRGLIVARTVAAGELVPRTAVGSTSGAVLAAVVVSTAGALPSAVVAGSRVDLWASPSSQGAGSGGVDADAGAAPTGAASRPGVGPPAVVAASATVVRVVDDRSLVSSGSAQSVELLVERTDLPDVLEAIADGVALDVVPDDVPIGG